MFDFFTAKQAALLYAFMTIIVILFQCALALGAPWGSLAMGGKFPGKYPIKMRIACLPLIAFLISWAVLMAMRAGLLETEASRTLNILVWIVVALNASGAIMNLITPSKWERRIWGPVALLMLLCSVTIALS